MQDFPLFYTFCVLGEKPSLPLHNYGLISKSVCVGCFLLRGFKSNSQFDVKCDTWHDEAAFQLRRRLLTVISCCLICS